ncbi:MAG: peptide deformylase [Candidatus Krumholzibacteriia bacterium]
MSIDVLPDRILRYGDERLRRRCAPVAPGDAAAAEVADRLWNALGAADGVGLAAPQIGESTRVVVVELPRESARRGPRELELFNPVVERVFGPRERFREGCLSFRGLYLPVVRARGAVVRYLDRGGQPRRLQDDGLLARVLQHEVDHLDGVLFLDRLPRWRRWPLALRLRRLTRARGDRA